MKPYIICEVAYNHEGDYGNLIRTVKEISQTGAQAVKFHLLINLDSYMTSNHPGHHSLKKWIFTKEQWNYIINYSLQLGLDVICLCDDLESIKYINSNFPEIFAIELHAVSINDIHLLKESVNFKHNVMLGVGGCIFDEIDFAVTYLRNNGKNDIILMYGFQSFPTDYKNINLNKMLKLKLFFETEVGYADHTGYDDPNNIYISAVASLLGIGILEKHYTTDVGVKRIDYESAVGKKEIIEIKRLMELNSLLISSDTNISEKEKEYGKTGMMKKAVVAKQKIKKGEKIELDNIWFKRTKDEPLLQQKNFKEILGKKVNVDIEKDDLIDYHKISFREVNL